MGAEEWKQEESDNANEQLTLCSIHIRHGLKDLKQNAAYKVGSRGKSKSSKKGKKTIEERECNGDEHSECCNRDMFYKLELNPTTGL